MKSSDINGKYNKLGYVVYQGSKPIYAGGNGLDSSDIYLPLSDPSRCELKDIEFYCLCVMRENSRENLMSLECVFDEGLNPEEVARQLGLI